jgi:hypothetical protein
VHTPEPESHEQALHDQHHDTPPADHHDAATFDHA